MLMNNEQLDLANSVNNLVDVCHGASYDAGWWHFKAEGINVDLRALVRDDLSTVAGLDPSVVPLLRRFAKALVAEKLMLTVSEIAEAMEGHRKNLQDDKLPHRKMIEVEIADKFIRGADLAGALGLDLGGAIVEKMAFNAVRPDHKIENRMAEGGKAY